MMGVTFGLGDAVGLATTHGLGGFFVVPTLVPDKKISPDVQHLINQVKQLTICKQSTSTLTMKLAIRNSDLDTQGSNMTDLHARLRNVEEQMRIFGRLRRITP